MSDPSTATTTGREVLTSTDPEARLSADEPITVLDPRDRDAVDRWRLSGPALTVVQTSNAWFVAATTRGRWPSTPPTSASASTPTCPCSPLIDR